jgi:hypothetical protein
MIVRAIDGTGDWEFGQSLNDYLTAQNAVSQSIATRLRSFLGDCFFDQGSGINWFGLLGGKDQLSLNLAVSAVILNTENVLSLNQLSINVSTERAVTISYTVQTSYSMSTNTIQVSI